MQRYINDPGFVHVLFGNTGSFVFVIYASANNGKKARRMYSLES